MEKKIIWNNYDTKIWLFLSFIGMVATWHNRVQTDSINSTEVLGLISTVLVILQLYSAARKYRDENEELRLKLDENEALQTECLSEGKNVKTKLHELKERLEAENFPHFSYTLDGSTPKYADDAFILSHVVGFWKIESIDRGVRYEEYRAETEDEACAEFYRLMKRYFK